ncbi:hypothetical protein G6011_03870 [Alternaria panax]|uniref:Uncharacterized protein n=1 Tax=Alternaria panax TaxID=48097 RepID=A0AAD4IG28_9PLEO|nr:hypothetical protein G6011_03870 [Alternaria panax]
MQRPPGRLSVRIIPEKLVDIPNTSSHWLFSKDGGYVTRLKEDYPEDTPNDLFTSAKVEARIMREIADWLQSQECDEFWTPRARQPRRALPTAIQLLRQLDNHEFLPGSSPDKTTAFESLLHVIALQLLAASYTHLPPSSANHIPLFQQRKETRFVTALHSHSRHRYSPAAGHQARPSSETDSWPDLYTGPSNEEKLAEHVSWRRRLCKQSNDYIPHFSASGWTDGPPAMILREDSRGSLSREISSSSSEPGFFSRLICQAAVPKNYRRRHNTMFLNRVPPKQKKKKQLRIEDKHKTCSECQDVSSQPVQRIPSVHRLRHTQSTPRMEFEAKEETPVESSHDGKRHGSDPSIGSPLNYSFQIPEIHRTSVTPSANWCPESSEEGMIRACGRGDLIVPQDYFDNTPETPECARNQHSQWRIPRWRQGCVGAVSSPYTISSSQSATSTPITSAVDYFTEVYTDKHIIHQTDDPDTAAEEHSDAGPEIEDDSRLRKMLGGVVTMPGEEDESSDSDMERTKKRKGIKESEAIAWEVAELFRGKTGDGIDHSTAKVVW